MTFKVLDLFSGIGGFSLGLERTGGFETVAFCEINRFSRLVLGKHWPEVPVYDDVRTLTVGRLAADGIHVDVIAGGFPCQDISFAGKGEGIGGERSGLWKDFSRLIGEIRPRFAIVENVAALLGRGLGDVLGDLASLGYSGCWHCIPAAAVGADHRRDRIWIVAYPEILLRPEELRGEPYRDLHGNEAPRAGADADGAKRSLGQSIGGYLAQELASLERGGGSLRPWDGGPFDDGEVDDGLSTPVDALDAYGNAVVPLIPQLIGNAILRGLASCESVAPLQCSEVPPSAIASQ